MDGPLVIQINKTLKVLTYLLQHVELEEVVKADLRLRRMMLADALTEALLKEKTNE